MNNECLLIEVPCKFIEAGCTFKVKVVKHAFVPHKHWYFVITLILKLSLNVLIFFLRFEPENVPNIFLKLYFKDRLSSTTN